MKNEHTSIYDFYDLWNSSQNQFMQKNLLLGNGFSIAAFPEFKYKNLYQFSILPNEIKDIFQLFGTYDYEIIMNKLNDYIKLCNHYKNNYYNYKIRQDILTIQTDLIQCLSCIHPQNLIDKKIDNTLSFLSNFKNIFTTNYDLILYWLIMFFKYGHFDDGFSRHLKFDTIWTNNRKSQNVFYLHGAIHLFNDKYNTYKIKNNANLNLLEQSINFQNNNILPLFITNGNSENKLNEIKNNNYLNYCYEYLKKINGYLIIHGHSLCENDKHIFDAIFCNRNIRKIYISVYKNDENVIYNAYNIFKDKINNDPLDLYFYDADSVRLWT